MEKRCSRQVFVSGMVLFCSFNSFAAGLFEIPNLQLPELQTEGLNRVSPDLGRSLMQGALVPPSVPLAPQSSNNVSEKVELARLKDLVQAQQKKIELLETRLKELEHMQAKK